MPAPVMPVSLPSVRRLPGALLAAGLALAALGGTARAQDASEFVVRLGRLESQSRMMAGQIETLQYENRQLREQLRKFQEDVEFRLNEKSGRPAAPAPAVNGGNPGTTQPPKQQKRSDAFDPERSPGAPGTPMQLGAVQPSAPLPTIAAPPAVEAPEAAPARIARPPQGAVQNTLRDIGEDDEAGYDEPVDITPPGRLGAAGGAGTALAALPPRPAPSVAATGLGDASDDYETAYGYIQRRQYEQAEMSLRQFIQSHPRDAKIPAATYWLGESYLQRNRTREAAEQFLKVSTDYARSAQAPEAMLKLGASLSQLGAREQACATLAELERKFPAAGQGVRQGVVREQKRARCAA